MVKVRYCGNSKDEGPRYRRRWNGTKYVYEKID